MAVPDPVRTLVAARATRAVRQQRQPATPADLAARIIPNYRITPAVSLISDVLGDAITGADRRVIITVPPRESKSTTVAVTRMLYALSCNSDLRIVLASYADSLAQEYSHTARALVAEHSDLLGFSLSSERPPSG